MRQNWPDYLFMLSLFTLLLAGLVSTDMIGPSHAQSNTCQITQELAAGQFICNRNGIEYRALPPAKVKELAQQKVDLAEARDLLRISEQKVIAQADALVVAEKAVNSCSETAVKFQAFIDASTEQSKRLDGFVVAQREATARQTDLMQATNDLVRGGRVSQLQRNPWFSVADSYLIRPSVGGLWNRLAGCR